MATEQQSQLIESRVQLEEHLAKGCRPPEMFRFGTEHEKFPFYEAGHGSVAYDGIQALLNAVHTTLGGSPILEKEAIIGLNTPDGASISLEPAGQLELSGSPLATLHHTRDELDAHLQTVKAAAKPLGIAYLGAGMTPDWTRSAMPFMPKARYGIMRNYMPKVGSLGLDMMHRTCTVQVNLDFSSEADMVQKFRVALALQPIATALFANSPFTDGKPNGFLSMRSHIWTDTDADRTGMLPFVFEEGMGFARYVDYALDVPMYFVTRNGQYHDVSGSSFRDFLNGSLPQLPGERPTLDDWASHLTTLFPEVRLKQFLEMRGADAGSRAMLLALPAFWVGIFHHQPSLDAAWYMVKNWTAQERHALRNAVPKSALKTAHKGSLVQTWALEVLALSEAGLKARALGEEVYLAPLWEIAHSGVTHAERLLQRYENMWSRSVAPLYNEEML